jgi:hypothetical protein
VDLAFAAAPVTLRTAELAVAVAEKVLLPRIAPQLDADRDGSVSLAELFASLSDCTAVTGDLRASCDATAPAIATLLQSGILGRIGTELPAGFQVALDGSLVADATGAAALAATLSFAGTAATGPQIVALTPDPER